MNKNTDWFNLRDANCNSTATPADDRNGRCGPLTVGRDSCRSPRLGMLAIGGATPTSIAHHTANWNLYETEARKAGHVPDRAKWRVVTLMHIAETREQAKKNVNFGLKAFADYFREIATFPIIPPDVPDDYDWLVETGTACIGTPDDAIAYIDKLLKGSGGFGVIMELAHNWADWEATRRHYELMARYVHSHFQKSFVPRVEALSTAAATQQKVSAGQAAQAVQSEIDKLAARQAKTGT